MPFALRSGRQAQGEALSSRVLEVVIVALFIIFISVLAVALAMVFVYWLQSITWGVDMTPTPNF